VVTEQNETTTGSENLTKLNLWTEIVLAGGSLIILATLLFALAQAISMN